MRSWTARVVVTWSQYGYRSGRLGESVCLEEIAAEGLHRLHQDGFGNRRRAVRDRNHRRKVRLFDLRRAQQELQHGWHE